MIYIFTQRDPFFIDSFLQKFDEFGVEYTVLDLPSFNKGFYSGVKRALALYGVLGFCKLVMYFIMKRPFFNLNNMVSFEKYTSVNNAIASLDSITDDDIILSLSAPCKIPIDKFPENIRKLNIHCGKLPEYAGMMPIFWQMLNGRSSITITIHDLAADIDTGRIVVEFPMETSASLFATSVQAKVKSAELFHDLLDKDLTFISPVRSSSNTTLTKFPQPDDVRRFKRGMKLI